MLMLLFFYFYLSPLLVLVYVIKLEIVLQILASICSSHFSINIASILSRNIPSFASLLQLAVVKVGMFNSLFVFMLHMASQTVILLSDNVGISFSERAEQLPPHNLLIFLFSYFYRLSFKLSAIHLY